jgi:hypothetical protein
MFNLINQITYISLENADFNVTGTVMFADDPLNFYLENITMDTYSLARGFFMPIMCNYPEAYYKGEVVVKNVTAVTSKDRTLALNTRVVYTNILGNSSIESVDLDNFYFNTRDIGASLLVFIYPN